jgi:hypothetical protein
VIVVAIIGIVCYFRSRRRNEKLLESDAPTLAYTSTL